jgi:hypothetical protein
MYQPYLATALSTFSAILARLGREEHAQIAADAAAAVRRMVDADA